MTKKTITPKPQNDIDKKKKSLSTFHERLKRTREKRGLSQEDLAEKLKSRSQSLISSWERNRLPSASSLVEICQALDVSADYLLGLHLDSEGSGMNWITSKPPENTPYHNQAIDDGIELFNEIMHNHKLPSEVTLRSRAKHDATMRTLLRNLFVAGVVRITHVERDYKLEAALFRAYPIIKDCIVVKLDLPSDNVIDAIIRNEAVAFVAANVAVQTLQQIKSVGIAGGSVISRWVDLLPPSYAPVANIEWVSMLSTTGSQVPFGNTSNALVGRLVYTQGVKGHRMPFINANRRTEEYYDQAEGYELDELRNARRILDIARGVDAIFMSVGTHETNYKGGYANDSLAKILREMKSTERVKCVGDIFLRLIDKDGNPVGNIEDHHQNDAIVYSISLDEVRNIADKGQVWILAGQAAKATCIHATLKASLANSLVIDSTVAQALLREKEMDAV